jgi:hypothetical protein
MKLNSYQKQVMHGLMLGDGHSTQAKSDTSNPFYTQTFGQHYELFAKHIFEILHPFCTNNGLYSYKVQSGKNSPFYNRFIVKTRSLSIFREFSDMYYEINNEGKRIKILPTNIESLLTPIVLAYLVMSDGHFHKSKQVIKLCTNNFTKQEVELLSTHIYNKFGLTSGLEHVRNEQYILRFRKSLVPMFQNIVKSHIIPSMLYRIGL